MNCPLGPATEDQAGKSPWAVLLPRRQKFLHKQIPVQLLGQFLVVAPDPRDDGGSRTGRPGWPALSGDPPRANQGTCPGRVISPPPPVPPPASPHPTAGAVPCDSPGPSAARSPARTEWPASRSRPPAFPPLPVRPRCPLCDGRHHARPARPPNGGNPGTRGRCRPPDPGLPGRQFGSWDPPGPVILDPLMLCWGVSCPR